MNQSTENEDNSGASQDCAGKQFVPVKSFPTGKLKKKKDPLVEAIHLIRSSLENDPSKNLIQFWTSEMRIQEQPTDTA